jgi:hypothetical protein
MADFSSGREFTPFERLLYRGAARDERTAALMSDMAARSGPIEQTMSPRRIGRALAMGATR